MTRVRGRFAPSPTGQMHLGNAWTALLAWLQIRHAGGDMVLRIEDLDPDRSRAHYTEQLMLDLKWLGLDWDEGPDIGGPYQPYYQHERRELYQQALAKLTAQGLIYPCYCTRAELHAASAPHAGEHEVIYPGTCRSLPPAREAALKSQGRRPALRIKAAVESISFTDGLHGKVTQQLSTSCGDFIVRRSDGVHAYQLAVVVDDGLMNINRVLRGDDLLASTARQIYLYRLLGFAVPEFTHVPLLYDEDGHRLSKRQHDLSLAALRKRGTKAEKIIGFLAWKANLIDKWEPVQASELIPHFNIRCLPHEPIIIHREVNNM